MPSRRGGWHQSKSFGKICPVPHRACHGRGKWPIVHARIEGLLRDHVESLPRPQTLLGFARISDAFGHDGKPEHERYENNDQDQGEDS
jgi:hypothetical protein